MPFSLASVLWGINIARSAGTDVAVIFGEGRISVNWWVRDSRQKCLIGLMSVCVICCSSLVAVAADASALEAGLSKINLKDLKRHVSTLAADSLEGREAGSRGGKAAAAYLRSELRRLRESYPVPQERTQEFGREYQNLLVLLKGSDEKLSHEVIVVGAHYDHVGYGNSNNSQGPFGQIHNGADDNASGSSALLELIEAFSALPTPPSRSILFAFWDAEEVGLLGSKHWVAHPTVPLADVRFDLNIDMLGRLRNGRVITVGWRSAPGLRQILAENNEGNQLLLAFQSRVIADSDHHPFYAAGIPIIHLDTDKHDDYHRPSDDADKVQWDGLQLMSRFAFRILFEMANRPEVPGFRSDVKREPPPYWMALSGTSAAPVRIGVTWDLDAARKETSRVAKITPDSPASNAGLRVGDRVIRLGNWENGSFADLKTTLQLVKNPVSIRVERPGNDLPVELKANFWGQAVRLGAGWIDDPAMPQCCVITNVVSDSPADRAGFSAGDIVMEMGGRPLASSEEMRLRVLEEPGPFRFRVERHGRIRDLVVDLLDEPLPQSRVTSSVKSGE